MKLILKNVKIYGFDPKIFREFENGNKQYSVGLIISDEDKFKIDSYIFGKTNVNQDGENVFYGKSKTPIPVFDVEKKRIEKPINEVFLADVSILIDEFTPEGKDEPVRYSKCLGIHYIKSLEEGKVRLPQKTYNTFDDIFNEEENENVSAVEQTNEIDENDDDDDDDGLPWDKDGNDKKVDDSPF